jgi:hypothetical protein
MTAGVADLAGHCAKLKRSICDLLASKALSAFLKEQNRLFAMNGTW